MPVARKLWQLMEGGRPALLARRLTIWNTICLFIRVPLSRDFVMSTAWNRGAFGDMPEAGGVHVLHRGTRPACGVPGRDAPCRPSRATGTCPLVVAEPVVLDVHCNDRADASEGVEHGRDQCTDRGVPRSCLLRSTRAASGPRRH